ncbi:uncharacterized protein PV09_03430 [Verruconis gallopava]|uniref:Transcription factor TFIIIC triple barrel domain-containing protein n=1 Tax=Verruconis gallopava TaxID=253628 RepID=A0A0D1YY11_9PEZI|nr:uncharacterized protein PV09_03430 [Verruconis gallopava]KIW05552.1 hypothetical protein PV09_03430 [Verruconis gallopava]
MDMIGDDDADWEYEYAENETEDYYVVLELPDTSGLKPKSKADELFAPHDPTKARGKAPHAGKKRRRGPEDGDVDGANEGIEGNDGDAASSPAEHKPNDDTAAFTQPRLLRDLEAMSLAATGKQSDGFVSAEDGLQIVDLGTDEPVIKYQGQIYNCQWAASIGSDLLFARRPEQPSPEYQPLYSFKDVDLLGIGAARLIASPATIERKHDLTRQSPLDAPLPEGGQANLNKDVVRQARFLGRIAEIKASRGEQVGNLKTLAESVFRTPENFGPDGRPLRRGRGGRGAAARAARRRAGAAAQVATNVATDAAAIVSTHAGGVSTHSEGGSTPTPVRWADLEDDGNAKAS